MRGQRGVGQQQWGARCSARAQQAPTTPPSLLVLCAEGDAWPPALTRLELSTASHSGPILAEVTTLPTR